MRVAIAAIILQDKELLLVKKKKSWISPGGKPEEGESDIECVCREVREELSGTELEKVIFYKSRQDISPHKQTPILVKAYFAQIKGQLYGPSAEIKGVAWIDDFDNYNISEPTKRLIESLKSDGYL